MRSKVGATWVAMGACALGWAGCAPAAPRADDVRETAQAYSAAQPSALQPYAVGVCTGQTHGACTFRCSGTLIAQNLVLTARHCIFPVPSPLVDCSSDTFGSDPIAPPGEFWVSTAEDMNVATSGWHQVLQFLLPQATLVCGADVALLVLKDSVPIQEAAPATPALDVIENYTKAGATVTAIGFGESGPGARDFGVRRVRQSNPIICLPGDSSLACSNQGESFVSREFVATTGACEGDSGSGVYDQTAFNVNNAVVLGVLSRGDKNSPGCSDGVYERLDGWAAFIAGGGKTAARLGGYAAPAWTNVPNAQDVPSGPSPFPPGALGAQCAANEDCDSKLCRSTDGGFTFACTAPCARDVAGSCPRDFSCVGGGAEQLCAYEPGKGAPATAGGGCAVSVRAPDGAAAILVVLAACCARRTRRTKRRIG